MLPVRHPLGREMKKERHAALLFRENFGGHGSKPKKSRARRFLDAHYKPDEETQEITGFAMSYVVVIKRQGCQLAAIVEKSRDEAGRVKTGYP